MVRLGGPSKLCQPNDGISAFGVRVSDMTILDKPQEASNVA